VHKIINGLLVPGCHDERFVNVSKMLTSGTGKRANLWHGKK